MIKLHDNMLSTCLCFIFCTISWSCTEFTIEILKGYHCEFVVNKLLMGRKHHVIYNECFFYLNDRFLKIESQRSIGYPLLQALDILYYGIKTRHIFWFWRNSLRISYCLIKGFDWFLKIAKSTHCRRVKKNYLRLLRLFFETFKIQLFQEIPLKLLLTIA